MELAVGQSVRIEGREGLRVDCIRGEVWLTQLGVLDDVFLRGGRSYGARGKGLIIVGAWKAPSVISVRWEPVGGIGALAALAGRMKNIWRNAWRRARAFALLETTAADIEARQQGLNGHRGRRSRASCGVPAEWR